MRVRSWIALGAVVSGGLAAPAAASTRYVEHGGVGSGNCLTRATACNAPYVLGGTTNSSYSRAGDTVIVLASGGALGLPEELQRKFILMGDPTSSARPEITSASSDATIDAQVAGTTISHLDIHATGSSAYGIIAAAGVTVSDVVVTSTGTGADLSGGSITNSTLTTAGTATGSSPEALLLRNGARASDVTLNAPATAPAGDGANGLWLVGNGNSITGSTVDGNVEIDGVSTARRLDVKGQVIGRNGATLTDSLVVDPATGARTVEAFSGVFRVNNVTAIANGGIGLYADHGSESQSLFDSPGQLDVVNSIARGGAADGSADAEAEPAAMPPPGVSVQPGFMTYSYDDLRNSPVAGQGAHDIAADPMFVDASMGDYRLAQHSPAIDAGTNDLLDGSEDLDGHPRVQGAAPDLGAYESNYGPRLTAFPTISHFVVHVNLRATTVTFKLNFAGAVKLTLLQYGGLRKTKKGPKCTLRPNPPRYSSLRGCRERAGSLTMNGVAGANVVTLKQLLASTHDAAHGDKFTVFATTIAPPASVSHAHRTFTI
jgi:hypothetical protein